MNKWIIIAAIVFVLAGIVIFTSGHYDFSSKQDVINFVKAYGSWTGRVVGNVVDITGYAIKKPWLPVQA